MDELLVVPFTRAFSRIRAERFAEMLVAPPVGADAVVVGENFRFGHGGAGTVEMLDPVRALAGAAGRVAADRRERRRQADLLHPHPPPGGDRAGATR